MSLADYNLLYNSLSACIVEISIDLQFIYNAAYFNHNLQILYCQNLSGSRQANILFVINIQNRKKNRGEIKKKHVLYLDYLWQHVNGRTSRSLGKQSLNTLCLTLCQCCQCLCNGGQKSIMSKLISWTRKLNRTCLKREEKMVNIALWKIDSASQTSTE